MRCQDCGTEFRIGATSHDPEHNGTLLYARVAGPVTGAMRLGRYGEIETRCATCDTRLRQKEPPRAEIDDPLYTRARNAGLPEGRVMNVLLLRAKEHGLEKALLRAIAEVAHDARPAGNDRSEHAWKRLEQAQAIMRRLAEIGAAPR